MKNNDSEIVLSYTIAAAAEPTVYDATVSKTSPIKLLTRQLTSTIYPVGGFADCDLHHQYQQC